MGAPPRGRAWHLGAGPPGAPGPGQLPPKAGFPLTVEPSVPSTKKLGSLNPIAGHPGTGLGPWPGMGRLP